MRRSHVTALIAGLASLLLVGVAAAVEAQDPPADAEIVEETTTTEDDDATDDAAEAPEVEDDDEGGGPHPENHGKHVSEAAAKCPPGSEHGPCVSAVARSNVGKGDKGDRGQKGEGRPG